MIEFALSLFFAKMVAYTFLFWLPYYVAYHRKWRQYIYNVIYYNNAIGIGGRYIGEQKADLLATLYDVGGIVGKLLMILKLLSPSPFPGTIFEIKGSIFTGGLSDIINARAISCVIMLYLAVPTVSVCVCVCVSVCTFIHHSLAHKNLYCRHFWRECLT